MPPSHTHTHTITNAHAHAHTRTRTRTRTQLFQVKDPCPQTKPEKPRYVPLCPQYANKKPLRGTNVHIPRLHTHQKTRRKCHWFKHRAQKSSLLSTSQAPCRRGRTHLTTNAFKVGDDLTCEREEKIPTRTHEGTLQSLPQQHDIPNDIGLQGMHLLQLRQPKQKKTPHTKPASGAPRRLLLRALLFKGCPNRQLAPLARRQGKAPLPRIVFRQFPVVPTTATRYVLGCALIQELPHFTQHMFQHLKVHVADPRLPCVSPSHRPHGFQKLSHHLELGSC